MWHYLMSQVPGAIAGALISGVASALSSKYLGWFNKQVKSVETRVGAPPAA